MKTSNCIVLIAAFLMLTLLVDVHFCNSAETLSQGKSYIITPQLNYQLSAPTTDCGLCADGRYTKGVPLKTTMGWDFV
jgi:hypothetical protein